MPFNEILVRERKARGLSQEELAARIQVSRQAVSKWETGDAMPDLNKLLALADALDISLDALCGREIPSAASAALAPQPAKKRSLLPLFFCALLLGCLLTGGLWVWQQRNVVPSEEASTETTLPDTFTISGLEFTGKSDYRVAYSFAPSVYQEGYHYQISFSTNGETPSTFDAPYENGVCSGIATLSGGWMGCSVIISVTDGVNSRNLAVADNLSFSEGGASWTPLPD